MSLVASSRLRRVAEPLLAAVLLGAGAGLVVLGVGGRVAMRAIALANGSPTGFTIGGTLTVVSLGIASGVGGGLLYAVLYRLLPQPRIVRSVAFGALVVLLTLRGLRPIQPFALEWFMPLALAYGVVVDATYSAWYRRRTDVGTSG